jgi:anti-sigma B factor antagonist
MHKQPATQGTVVVALPAEIDIANAEQVQRQLAAALKPGVTVLVADLTGTIFCDASGISALLRARARAAETGAELRLVVPPGRVHRLLDVLGLAGHLQIYPTTSHAQAAAGRGDHDRPELADRA